MRNVLAFGTEPEFVEEFSAVINKHGFDLKQYDGLNRQSLNPSPILLVSPVCLGQRDREEFFSILETDRRLPVIYIEGGAPSDGAIKSRARFVIPKSFLKKDLVGALKGSREVLDLRESLDAVKGELKAKTLELAQVLDIGKTLASSFELPKVLARIMEHMRATVRAEGWAVFLLDETNQELALESSKGMRADRKNAFRIKVGDGIAGWCAAEKDAKLVADVSKSRRFHKEFGQVAALKVHSLMAVPIISGQRLLGVIELFNKRDGAAFDGNDLAAASRLLDQTAIAIERATMYQRMADLVITDDLTKLFNTRYLHRTLDVEIERAMRYNLSVALIFMDLDYFKKVNDRHGHLTGSKLLVEVSQLLMRYVRKVDIVARYGGDEFVIVLPQTDVQAAKLIAERLRKKVEKNVFLKSENLSIRLTASFGIACYPEHASGKEELVRLADEAMYKVKSEDRNSVYVVEARRP